MFKYVFNLLILAILSSCDPNLSSSFLPKAQSQINQNKISQQNQNSTSNLIKMAYWVVINESAKLQAACNIYVMRVLESLGFNITQGFLANDFDLYAKKNIKNYKQVFFTETTELKRHLWSYPEREGFIIQWKRKNGPGHIAIVERVGDQLYAYQASLNRYHARINETNIETLLAMNGTKGLTVFSEISN